MKSYPTTRVGKIHIRLSGTIVSGTVACNSIRGAAHSVSTLTAEVANCKSCVKAWQKQTGASTK